VSNHLISMAYKRDLRTPMRKSVMALLADKASDDGGGIYASKQTMADELCCSRQAVFDTIKAFVSEGLLEELGTRRFANGHTVEYGIVVERLEALPLVKCHADREQRRLPRTRKSAGPVNHVDPSTTLTSPVNQVDPNPPKPTSQEATPPSKPRERAVSTGSRLDADWRPASLNPSTVSGQVIERRGQGWARQTFEIFQNYWRGQPGKAGRKSDWQATWANWVIEQDRRDARYGTLPSQAGLRGSRPNPALDMYREACAEEAAGSDTQADSGAWLSLPPHLADGS